MAPTYTYQDSFPYQTSHVQCAPYFHPTPEAVPSKMMVGPSIDPVFHANGPYGANYSYPYHSSCNHMPFPGHFSYGPTCPHVLSPQPSPWWGSYPVYPQPIPVYYVSPPNYPAEIPRYEYDKDVSGPRNYHHCCGCPNHASKPKGERNVWIEEQEPKPSIEKGKPSPENVGEQNYPIIWIPPEYLKSKEHKLPSELKSTEPKFTLQDARPQEISPWQEPDQNDHGKGSVQPEDSRRLFSYPIIWMPLAKTEGSEREEERNSGEKNIPVKEANSGVKNIPVKEAKSSSGILNKENSREMSSEVSGNKVKESSRSKQPVSPKEKAKLPPVCLRVDPLPRKKNPNGSSRSPSPPGTRRSASSGVMDDEARQSPVKAANEKKIKQEKMKEIKVVETEGRTCKKDKEMVSEPRNDREDSDERKNETVVKFPSEVEAATLIQAAYRGFEVRKWETKKKLKQMARIREEMAKIKNSIRELESSLCGSLNQEKVTKWRMMIGESIMNLLLTLDTIQGLHPGLRDVRKSLAKEMVALQEQLDLLVCKRTDGQTEKQASVCSEEKMHEISVDDAISQHSAVRKEDVQSVEADSSEAQNGGESPEAQLATAETSPCFSLEKESSGAMVSCDHGSQGIVTSDVNCGEEKVESDESIEKVPDMKKLLKGAEHMDVMEEGHEKSNNGGKSTEVLPTGELAGRDHETNELQEKLDTPYGQQQHKTLGEEAEGSKEATDVEGEPLKMPGTQKSEEPGDREEGNPVTLYEEGAYSFPSEEMKMPEHMEDGGSAWANEKYEENPEEEEENSGEVLPMALPEEGGSTAPNNEIPAGQVKEEMYDKMEAVTEKEKVLDEHKGNETISVFNKGNVVVAEDNKAGSDGTGVMLSESKPSDGNLDDELVNNGKKLQEENEKLREMMQRLMEAGKEQLDVISSLTGRVKDLEKKLAKNNGKARRSNRCRTSAVARQSRLKPSSKVA